LVFFAVGVAPVVEELLFRGLLLPIVLQGRSFLFGALLTSLYFALIHLHAPSLLPLLLLSVGFSAGYAATGSILTPIAMHVVFNVTGLLLFFAEIK
jgi:membrane protease YdiL (CAAX protease family)